MTAHVSTAIPNLSDLLPNAPNTLVRLVESILFKNPDDRPAAPMDVANRLTEFAVDFGLPALVELAEQSEPTVERPVLAACSSTA